MCHPKYIFTLQFVAARLHDQATTSKKIERATEIPLCLLLFFSGLAVTLERILIFNIFTYQVGKLTLTQTHRDHLGLIILNDLRRLIFLLFFAVLSLKNT